MPPTDLKAFARDLEQLRADVDSSLSANDWRHLQRFDRAARLLGIAGYATAWVAVNPLSALLLSTATFVRWAVLMHHVGHRGYDKVPGVPPRYTSRRFAAGWRRYVDWLDWIPPAAWRYEHNSLHHGRTNEEADPDFVERNAGAIRRAKSSRLAKYLQVAFFICTWKLSYYMPSVLRALRFARLRRAGTPSAFDTPKGLRQFYNAASPAGRQQWREILAAREYWLDGVLPYGVVRFGLIPAAFLPFGLHAATNVLLTTLLAEVLTNVHSFLAIVPNHAGDDLSRFEMPASSRAEFYYRQVTASVNYTSPGAWSDFLQGGLNFQIEHHLWPDLPLSQYRALAPRVKAVCARHHVPYLEQPLVCRVGKTLAVLVGNADHPAVDPIRSLSTSFVEVV